ncbi:MAG: phosphoglycerate kinase, partial [Pseudomonadales bacterium]
MAVKQMKDLALAGKRVLVREDLNVPIKNGAVASDARIRAALPTIKAARDAGAKLILMSHLGRPAEGASAAQNAEFSLAPVAQHLGKLLDCEIPLVIDWRDAAKLNSALDAGGICLLENVRFNAGEKKDDPELAKAYAQLCDIFVMDAFGTAHRAQASTHGVARYAPQACAGPLLSAELNALEKALATPARPVVAIVGGSKVSTKLTVLESLGRVVDQLIVGGGIANTFLAAAGKNVGKSLCEHDLIKDARALADKTKIPLPIDVVVGDEFSESAAATLKPVDEVADDEMIFDVGPQTSK